jgi:hypothetical protein
MFLIGYGESLEEAGLDSLHNTSEKGKPFEGVCKDRQSAEQNRNHTRISTRWEASL